MNGKHVPPQRDLDAFNCPHCGAFAAQTWGTVQANHREWSDIRLSVCTRCGQPAIWQSGRLISPDDSSAPPPHSDLPEELRADYEEARGIVGRSPRGACALLRLVLQKLLQMAGGDGASIKDDIRNLLRAGAQASSFEHLRASRLYRLESCAAGQFGLG